MSRDERQRPFARVRLLDRDDLVGARWWREGLCQAERAARTLERPFLRRFALFGGAAALASGAGCVHLAQPRDEMELEMSALELQRVQGWNVGQAGRPLAMPGATAVDVDGGTRWRDGLDKLVPLLAPAQAGLRPYYVPTLFQLLGLPQGADLRASVRPLWNERMAAAFARGQSMLSLFGQVGWPTDTAVLVDVPGAEAVAFAAGMAERFEPVFTFDNWPHPLGVVASHQTLGAVLYYLPLFERARAARRPPAPPVFVLDQDRLSPYRDADRQFDNRYVAKLPTPEGFAALGIHHVLYVVPDAARTEELDDLNQDFVALEAAGIDVKMVALSDFQELAEGDEALAENDEVEEGAAPWFGFRVGCFWGGSIRAHRCFWDAYHGVGLGSASPPPPGVSQGCHYHPKPRPTVFGGVLSNRKGMPPPPPHGFGRVAVRASRETGALTGLRAGRSGSFGRVHAALAGGGGGGGHGIGAAGG